MEESTKVQETKTEKPVELTEEQEREIATRWLDKATPEDILRHSRVGGILGNRIQIREQVVRQEEAARALEAARREIEEENLRLADEDPAELARRYKTDKVREREEREKQEQYNKIEQEFSTAIGETFKAIPEFQNLTPEEFNRLQVALEGKTNKREILAIFTTVGAEIVADRKAEKRLADYRAKELPKEREAIRTEEAAKRLQTSERPDLAKGSSTRTKFDPSKMSDKDFAEFYNKEMLGRI